MSLPWMPFYVADYLADTGHLSTIEHGAYMLLIMHYWRMEGLPTDDASLARISRMEIREWRKAKKAIRPLFLDGWKHGRIESELTESKRLSEAGRKGGLASGKARTKNKHKSNQSHKLTVVERFGNDSRTDREALQPQSQSQPIKKDIAPSARDKDFKDGFIEFYSAYPKKKAPREAEKAYIKTRLQDVSHQQIMDGVARAKQLDSRFRDIQFTPYPASWLNDGCYDDDKPPPDEPMKIAKQTEILARHGYVWDESARTAIKKTETA